MSVSLTLADFWKGPSDRSSHPALGGNTKRWAGPEAVSAPCAVRRWTGPLRVDLSRAGCGGPPPRWADLGRADGAAPRHTHPAPPTAGPSPAQIRSDSTLTPARPLRRSPGRSAGRGGHPLRSYQAPSRASPITGQRGGSTDTFVAVSRRLLACAGPN